MKSVTILYSATMNDFIQNEYDDDNTCGNLTHFKNEAQSNNLSNRQSINIGKNKNNGESSG